MYLVKNKKLLALLAAAVIMFGCGLGLETYSNQLTPRDNWLSATEATSVTWATEATAAGETYETVVPTTEATQPVEDAPPPAPSFWQVQENVKMIAGGIMLVGLIFACFYCWAEEMEPSKLGPDGESVALIALGIFLVLIHDSLWYSPLAVLLAGMVLGAIGILLLRGVVQWFKAKCPASRCLCWRLGARGVEYFYKVQFCFMTLFLCLGIAFMQEYLGPWVLFLSGYPIYCMMMLARDTDHF